MQFSTIVVGAIMAVAGTYAQGPTATIDRYTPPQQGCVPFGSPLGGSQVLNPTPCSNFATSPAIRSLTIRQLSDGCNISLFELANCASGGQFGVLPNITVADNTQATGCKTLNRNFASYALTCR